MVARALAGALGRALCGGHRRSQNVLVVGVLVAALLAGTASARPSSEAISAFLKTAQLDPEHTEYVFYEKGDFGVVSDPCNLHGTTNPCLGRRQEEDGGVMVLLEDSPTNILPGLRMVLPECTAMCLHYSSNEKGESGGEGGEQQETTITGATFFRQMVRLETPSASNEDGAKEDGDASGRNDEAGDGNGDAKDGAGSAGEGGEGGQGGGAPSKVGAAETDGDEGATKAKGTAPENPESVAPAENSKRAKGQKQKANAKGKKADKADKAGRDQVVIPLSGWFNPDKSVVREDDWELINLCGLEEVSGWALKAVFPPLTFSEYYIALPDYMQHSPPNLHWLMTNMGMLEKDAPTLKTALASFLCMAGDSGEPIMRFHALTGAGEWEGSRFETELFMASVTATRGGGDGEGDVVDGENGANNDGSGEKSDGQQAPRGGGGSWTLEGTASFNGNAHHAFRTVEQFEVLAKSEKLVSPTKLNQKFFGTGFLPLELRELAELLESAVALLELPPDHILANTLLDFLHLRLRSDISQPALNAGCILGENALVVVLRSQDPNMLSWFGLRPGSLIVHVKDQRPDSFFPTVMFQISFPYSQAVEQGASMMFDVRFGSDNYWGLRYVAIVGTWLRGLKEPDEPVQIQGSAQYRFERKFIADPSWFPNFIPEQATMRGELVVSFKDGALSMETAPDDPVAYYGLDWTSVRCTPPQTASRIQQEFVFFVDSINLHLKESSTLLLDGLGGLTFVNSPSESAASSSRVQAHFAAPGSLVYANKPGVATSTLFGETKFQWADEVANRYLWEMYRKHGCYSVHIVRSALESVGGFDLQIPDVVKELKRFAASYWNRPQEFRDKDRAKSGEDPRCEFLHGYVPWPTVHRVLKNRLGWAIKPTSVGELEASFMVELLSDTFVIPDDPDCATPQRLDKDCIPKITQCLNPTEERMQEAMASVCGHEGVAEMSKAEFELNWGLCWEKWFRSASCVAAEPLLHINEVMKKRGDGHYLRAVVPTKVEVFTKRHVESGETTHAPLGVYVGFRASLGTDEGTSVLENAVPPYMVSDPDLRSRARDMLKVEEAAIQLLRSMVTKFDCGAQLMQFHPHYAAVVWRRTPAVRGSPLTLQRKMLRMEKVSPNTYQTAGNEPKFLANINLYLIDQTGEMAPTRFRVKFCPNPKCRGKQLRALRPLKHFLLPTACTLDTGGGGGGGNGGDGGDSGGANGTSAVQGSGGSGGSGGDDEDVPWVVCAERARLSFELYRPLLARTVQIEMEAVDASRPEVLVRLAKFEDADSVYMPSSTRFHASGRWRPYTDEELSQLDEAKLLDYAYNIAPDTVKRNLDKSILALRAERGRLEQLVRDMQAEFQTDSVLGDMFPAWLSAASFGAVMSKVVVGIDAEGVRARLHASLGPETATFQREDAGFLRYLHGYADRYLAGEPDVVDETGHRLHPGLYGTFCSGLCDTLWEYETKPAEMAFRSLAPLPLPRRVRYGDYDLGLSYVHFDHFWVDINTKEFGVDVAALFPQRSKPTILGGGVELDELTETLKDVRLSMLRKFNLVPKTLLDKTQPSLARRALRLAAQRHQDLILRLTRTQTLGCRPGNLGYYRQVSHLSGVLENKNIEFFSFRLAFAAEGEAALGLQIAPVPAKSGMLSLPISGDRVRVLEPEEDSYFRREHNLVVTVESEVVHDVEHREEEFTHEAELFFPGEKVKVGLGSMTPWAGSAGAAGGVAGGVGGDSAAEASQLGIEFVGVLGGTGVSLRPPTAGIHLLLRHLGYGDLARWIGPELEFTRRGMVDVIKREYRRLPPGGDPVTKCKAIMRAFFDDNAEAVVLASACAGASDAVGGAAAAAAGPHEEKQLRGFVHDVLLSHAYAGSVGQFLNSKFLIPDRMAFVVRLNADGTAQFGLDTATPLQTVTRTGFQEPNEPKLLGVKLFRLIGGSILGGDGSLSDSAPLVAVEPTVELHMEVSLIPIIEPPNAKTTRLLRNVERRAPRNPSSRFDNTFLFHDVRLRAVPSASPSYCLLCQGAMGVEAFSPYDAGVTFVVANDCSTPGVGNVDQKTGTLLRPGLRVRRDAGIRLPFVKSIVRLPEKIPPPAELNRIMNVFFPCDGTAPTTSSAVGGLSYILSSSSTTSNITVEFEALSFPATIVFTSPSMFDSGKVTLAPELLRIGLAGLTNLIDIAEVATFGVLSVSPEAKPINDWETPRVDERHPESLSPVAYRKFKRQRGKAKAARFAMPALQPDPVQRAGTISHLMEGLMPKLLAGEDEKEVGASDENVMKELAVVSVDHQFGGSAGVGAHVQGAAAFLISDLLEQRLRGGFRLEALTSTRSAEITLEGAILYSLSSVLGFDLRASGRVRIADRMGPVTIRISNEVMLVEMHLGLDDIRVFVVVLMDSVDDEGQRVPRMDVRVGSAELVGMKPASPVASAWWGPGKQVTAKALRWLLKVASDDTKMLPPVSDLSVFSMVRLVGTAQELQASKGRVSFHTNSQVPCFELDVEDWGKQGAWSGFQDGCNLQLLDVDEEDRLGDGAGNNYRGCTRSDKKKKKQKNGDDK